MESRDLKELPLAMRRAEYQTSLGCLVFARRMYYTGNVRIEHVVLSMEDDGSKSELQKVHVK